LATLLDCQTLGIQLSSGLYDDLWQPVSNWPFQHSGRRQALSVLVNEAVQHDADDREGDYHREDFRSCSRSLGCRRHRAERSCHHPPVRHDDEACDDGGPADDDQRRFKQAGEQDRYRLQMLSVKIALSQQYRPLIRFSRSPALSTSCTSTLWTRTPTRKSEISFAMWRLDRAALFPSS
jgi:hypothetical protein